MSGSNYVVTIEAKPGQPIITDAEANSAELLRHLLGGDYTWGDAEGNLYVSFDAEEGEAAKEFVGAWKPFMVYPRKVKISSMDLFMSASEAKIDKTLRAFEIERGKE